MKIKTLYSVQCVRITPDGKKEYVGGICGLFKDSENANAFCNFLSEHALPNFTYEIHCVSTDLK